MAFRQASEIPWSDVNESSIPDSFRLSDEGLFLAGDKRETLIAGPLAVIGKSISVKGQNAGRKIRYRTADGRDEIAVFRNVDLHSPESLMGLVDKYFLIIPRKIPNLAEHILLFNNKDLPTVINSNTLGWTHYNGERIYVTPEKSISRSGVVVEYLPERCDPIRTSSSGTLLEWKNNVAQPCRGNYLLIVALGVSFSGRLIEWTGSGTLAFHLVGITTGGKTTTLQVAASVHGNGIEPGSGSGQLAPYLQKWNQTANGFEATLVAYNDRVCCLDEMGSAPNMDIGKLVYNLIGGNGKVAMNQNRQLRAQRTWRLSILSSGEVTLKSAIEASGGKAKGGQLVRIVDIPTSDNIFQDTHGFIPKEFSEELKDNSGRFYGTAADAFIRAIKDNTADDAALQKLINDTLDIAKKELALSGLKPEQCRVIDRLAVPLMAAKLASQFEIIPLNDYEITAAFKTARDSWLANSGSTMNDTSRAIEAIVSFLQTQAARFINSSQLSK